MYYQSYEDYMRNVLGYPVENENIYQMDYLGETKNCIMSYQDTKDLEECYPEVYKIINPIVCEVCEKCNMPVTRDILENMVEEVYRRVEINNEIAIKVNIDNSTTEKQIDNRTNTSKINSVRNNISNEQTRKISEDDNRQRRPNNPFLNDLIRILILNRLLGVFFLASPNRPRPQMRPPFPGGPKPPRREFRTYDDYFKF